MMSWTDDETTSPRVQTCKRPHSCPIQGQTETCLSLCGQCFTLCCHFVSLCGHIVSLWIPLCPFVLIVSFFGDLWLLLDSSCFHLSLCVFFTFHLFMSTCGHFGLFLDTVNLIISTRGLFGSHCLSLRGLCLSLSRIVSLWLF